MYCPVCGMWSIQRSEPNAPVKDFVCESCSSQYELKSKNILSSKYTTKVNDGEYQTMINRITSLDNPSFFFLHYDKFEVNNLIIVPKCFFVPEVIEKRKPLSLTARRAGWQGCNILLNQIPDFAKIPIIYNGEILDKREVCKKYNRVLSLQTNSIESRGWLFDVLKYAEKLDAVFTLKQMYNFVDELQIKYPFNNNIKAKIRQQLQFLRNRGYIEFLKPGIYRKIR